MGAIYPPDHADGCACDACCTWVRETPGPELIHVGLPFLMDAHNGYAKASAQDGEVWLTVRGFGSAELSMPKAEATALRDQLTRAIEQL